MNRNKNIILIGICILTIAALSARVISVIHHNFLPLTIGMYDSCGSYPPSGSGCDTTPTSEACEDNPAYPMVPTCPPTPTPTATPTPVYKYIYLPLVIFTQIIR
jgi:hypothetical protein